MTTKRPRIGVIGTGAIGGFYGGMLAQAGHDVHFLLRSEYDEVAANGLRIESAVTGTHVLNPVQAYRDVADMPPCDWLLVCAKTTSNAALAPVIAQAAGPGATVVLLQNGYGVEDSLRPLLPEKLSLLGGLCFICVHRGASGVVVHEALGGINFAFHSGPRPEEASLLVNEVTALFKEAGVDATSLPNLDQARWQKLVWNAPFNGLAVLLDSGTEGLLGHPESRALVRAIMDETLGAAAACGHALPAELPERMLMGTARMPNYLPSMYHDYRRKRPMELDALYAAPLAAAEAAGFAMPRTAMLLQALRFLEARTAS